MDISKQHHWLNSLLFALFLGLIMWAPLPLGSNRIWAWTLLEVMVFALTAMTLIAGVVSSRVVCFEQLRAQKLVVGAFFLHLFFLALQCVPIPLSVVEMLNPLKASWFYWSDIGEAPEQGVLTASWSASVAELLKQQAYILVFCLALVLVDSVKRLVALAVAMVAISLFEVVYGVAAHYLKDSLPFWRPTWYGHDWISGTFINRNHFSANVSLSAALVIGFYLSLMAHNKPLYRAKILRERFVQVLSRFMEPRNLLLGLLFVLFTGLFLAQSRGALLALTVSILTVFGFGVATRGLRSPEGRLLPYLAVISIASAVWLGVSGIFERIVNVVYHESFRVEVWRQSLEIFREHWLLGVGNGAFQYMFTQVKTEALGANLFDFAHNDHLQLLVEQGVVGASLWFFAVFTIAWRMLKGYHQRTNLNQQKILAGVLIACSAFFLHGFVDFNFHIPANALWFYALLGVGLALSERGYSKRYRERS